MLTIIIFVLALIPVNLGASTVPKPSARPKAAAGAKDVSSVESDSTLTLEFLLSALKTVMSIVIWIAKLPLVIVKQVLYILFKLLETLLVTVTSPVSALLKILLMPVVFLLRFLLLVVKFVGDIILNALVYFVLWPILTILGMGSTITGLKLVLESLDLLQDNVSCLLSTLSYFGGLLPGCDTFGKKSQEDLLGKTAELNLYSNKVYP